MVDRIQYRYGLVSGCGIGSKSMDALGEHARPRADTVERLARRVDHSA